MQSFCSVLFGDEYIMHVFIGVPYLWYQADMDVAEVFPLHLELELSESLDEGHALDVAHCASQLLKHEQPLRRQNCMH